MQSKKKLIWLFIPSLLIFLWAGWLHMQQIKGEENWKKIRFDGLYVSSPHKNGGSQYLRFYADRTVISAAASGEARQVAKWFYRGQTSIKRAVLAGPVTLRGNHIWFTAKGRMGSVDFSGSVNDRNELSLWSGLSPDAYSGPVDLGRRSEYTFVEVSPNDLS